MSSLKFGERIAQLRKEKNFSQIELSRRVGFTQSYLSRIERGLFDPPADIRILALADALDADRESLLAIAGRDPEGVKRDLVDRQNKITSLIKLLESVDRTALGVVVSQTRFFITLLKRMNPIPTDSMEDLQVSLEEAASQLGKESKCCSKHVQILVDASSLRMLQLAFDGSPDDRRPNRDLEKT